MEYRPLAVGLIARPSTCAVILGMTVACTVHQSSEAPPLAGPSTFAESIAVTANPDLITQDGASQSAINVRVFDANGQPMSAIPLRIDILVNGTLVDYGTLSTKTIVTGLDGRATTVYTAPPPPPPTAQTASTVTIRATKVGTDAPALRAFFSGDPVGSAGRDSATGRDPDAGFLGDSDAGQPQCAGHV